MQVSRFGDLANWMIPVSSINLKKNCLVLKSKYLVLSRKENTTCCEPTLTLLLSGRDGIVQTISFGHRPNH